MNAESKVTETPRAERVALRAEVRSRHAGGKPYPTDIRNLSPGGCCIELPYKADLGERLWVTLPGLQPIEAEVCWAETYVAGCAFKTPLYPAVFDHIRNRIGS